MRQVPTDSKPGYGIIGNGKVAKHVCRYFELLGIPYRHWYRKMAVNRLVADDHRQIQSVLKEMIEPCHTVLLLISDSQIEPFIQANEFLHNKTVVHFSGQLVSKAATGVHPLMTFSDKLYGLSEYKKIRFICEKGKKSFRELFPYLPNTYYTIEPDKKPLYHALCVMGGNFTTILWEKLFKDFSKELSLPPEAALPYLSQTTKNLSNLSESVLTGPLQRNDRDTIESNLKALEGDPYQAVYKSFVDAYTNRRDKGYVQ
jgi:hypothetical protein